MKSPWLRGQFRSLWVAQELHRHAASMLKITCTTNGYVVFALSGRLEAMSLQELSHLIARARLGRAVTLELKDLQLADREAVAFLRACLEKGIELRNCPRYIQTWMESGEDGVREL